MENRKFTSGGEVAAYLLVHVVWAVAAGLLNSFLFTLVRRDAASAAENAKMIGLVSMGVLLITVPLIMLLFFGLRQAFGPRDQDPGAQGFATAGEAGAYLTSRLLMFTLATTIGATVSPTVMMNFSKASVMGIPVVAIYFNVLSQVFVLLGMLVFFTLRLAAPRLFRVCFSFAGRCSRAEYWGFGLAFYGIAAGAILAWFLALSARYGFNVAATPELLIRAGSPIWLWYIFILWPALALAVKRMHDRNRSGWFILVFYAAMIVAGILSVVARATDRTGIFVLVSGLLQLAASIWAFVEIGCLRGTVGPNRFGPDPVPNPYAANPAASYGMSPDAGTAPMTASFRDPNQPPPMR